MKQPQQSIIDGRLCNARWRASPNYNLRPVGITPDLVVLHNISLPPGQFTGDYIDQLFMNCLDSKAHPYFAQLEGLKVSAHLLIRRDGEMLQYVNLLARAWHAGLSSYAGVADCNNNSIGIELEGCDEQQYSDQQYSQLVSVLKAIQQTWPACTTERIIGHADIAPGRKTDPGAAFDWLGLQAALKAE